MLGALSTAFNGVADFVFSWHGAAHMALMMGMVFVPVAGAAAAAGQTATLGDLFMGGLDMGWSMVSGYSDVGVVGDAFANAANGNFAAGSYEFGTMNDLHAGHEIGHEIDHGAGHSTPGTGHVMEGGSHSAVDHGVLADAGAHGAADHAGHCTGKDLAEVFQNLTPEEFELQKQLADKFSGGNLWDHFVNGGLCSHGPK